MIVNAYEVFVVKRAICIDVWGCSLSVYFSSTDLQGVAS